MKYLLALTVSYLMAGPAFCDSLKVTLDKASESVVRVMVIGSEGSTTNAVGTGFVCGDKSNVVTAYHLLVGARRVLIRCTDSNVPRKATISKIYKGADVALLRLEEPFSGPPLPIGTVPDKGSQVLSLGHAYGADSLESLTQMKIREIGGRTLNEILGDDNKREIEKTGYPTGVTHREG